MSLERTLRRSLASLPLISLLLVACANTGDGAGSDRGTDPADLTGVDWVLDEASIAALADAVPDGAQVTLTFEGDQAGGTAACNSYGGAYRAGDDGSLTFEGFAVTEMACEPPLMTLEAAYLEVLGGVTAFEVDAVSAAFERGDDAVLLTGGAAGTVAARGDGVDVVERSTRGTP